MAEGATMSESNQGCQGQPIDLLVEDGSLVLLRDDGTGVYLLNG